MIFALAGNQNCGKTTLFNALTGANQHVGNFPGVTVDQKVGTIRGTAHQVVDLPGIYSIRPYTQEEIVTRDFILKSNPDAILNIVDATNIERNLYLTLQLLTLRVPTVIALNMMDELTGNGGSIDVQKLSDALGVPVVPISAAKNEGISELVDILLNTAENRVLPKVQDFCPDGPVHRCIHAVCHIIEDHAQRARLSRRFAATKLIEGEQDFYELLQLNQNEKELIEHSIIEMESDTGLDRNAALADMRYNFIEGVCGTCVTKASESREHRRSVKIDRVLTNRYLALPLFAAIMGLVFYLTFNVIGAFLSDVMAYAVDGLTMLADRGLTSYGINPVVHSLIIDGIFAGVGSVLSFLPIIVTLFFFLSILEDSGYMARVAFVMDKLLRKIGLSGRSFVPMLIGFGCSVPAIMATRTLSSNRDRKMTILLTQEHAVPGQPRPLCDGAAQLSLSLGQERPAADVGKGRGLFDPRLYRDLYGHGDHLVPANLRSEAECGGRQHGQHPGQAGAAGLAGVCPAGLWGLADGDGAGLRLYSQGGGGQHLWGDSGRQHRAAPAGAAHAV